MNKWPAIMWAVIAVSIASCTAVEKYMSTQERIAVVQSRCAK